MSGVPVLIEAEGMPVLVVGGGPVAARKARALSDAGARVRIVATATSDAVEALAAEGRVVLERRPYREGDVGDAMLVIAATDDRAVNAAIGASARAACRLANVADLPDDGTFSSMATHRAGPLVVGVSAGAPAAAARIRDEIAQRFDDRYGRALGALAEVRERLLAEGEGARWQAASAAVVDTRFCEAVETGTFDARMRPWR